MMKRTNKRRRLSHVSHRIDFRFFREFFSEKNSIFESFSPTDLLPLAHTKSQENSRCCEQNWLRSRKSFLLVDFVFEFYSIVLVRARKGPKRIWTI